MKPIKPNNLGVELKGYLKMTPRGWLSLKAQVIFRYKNGRI